jgi:hypothetical protein
MQCIKKAEAFFALAAKTYGGLMKKSLIYGTAAALAILLAFAACEQPTDDDGNSAETIPSYQSDLDGIAIAFADGAPTVYLKNDLHIGKGELVVPEGKTLDLTDRGRTSLTLDRFEAGGKLVILGNITFGQGNNKDVNMGLSGAYLIARKGYVDANVNIVEDPNKYTADPNRHIVVTADQVIYIAEGLNMADSASWEKVITDQTASSTGDYIAVAYSGTVDQTIATNINKYAYGRKLYIIGNVTLTGGIELQTLSSDTGPYRWAPPAPVESSTRNIAYGDAPSSLAIAGNAIFEGPDATVGTEKGFTVFGAITTGANRTDTPINKAGLLAAYVANIDGGAAFVGDVHLLSKALTSNLGNSVTFSGGLVAEGAVVVTAVVFLDTTKSVVFNGSVEFKGQANEVDLLNAKFNGPVLISNGVAPVDPTKLGKFAEGTTLTYDQDFTISEDKTYETDVTFKKKLHIGSASALNISGNAVFMGPVTSDMYTTVELVGTSNVFRDTVQFGSLALLSYAGTDGAVTFDKAVKFGDITTDGKGTGILIAGNIDFNSDVTFGDTGAGSFTSNVEHITSFGGQILPSYNIAKMPASVVFSKEAVFVPAVTFEGNATFNDTVSFGSNSTFNSGDGGSKAVVEFNKAVSFGGIVNNFAKATAAVKFNDRVVLGNGTESTLYFAGNVTYTNGLQGKIALAPAATGKIGTISSNDVIRFENGNIAGVGGKITLGSVSATFTNAGLVLEPGLAASATGGSQVVNIVGQGLLDFAGYEVKGAGSFVALNDPLTLTGSGIKTNTDGSTLRLDTTGILLNLKNNVALDGVALDLTTGGTIGVYKTSGGVYNGGQVTLALRGGTTAYAKGVAQAGIIKLGTDNGESVYGGTIGAAGTAPAGVILANGAIQHYNGGDFVTNAGEKYVDATDTAPAGSVGMLGPSGTKEIAVEVNKFVPFYDFKDAQSTVDAVWGYVNTNNPGSGAIGAGSIAVFAVNPDAPPPAANRR